MQCKSKSSRNMIEKYKKEKKQKDGLYFDTGITDDTTNGKNTGWYNNRVLGGRR